MKISEDQFFTYMQCPIKYDLKYNKGIVFESFDIKDILNKIIKSFYSYMITDRKVMSFNQLTKKFDAAMKPYEGTVDNKKLIDAVFLLRNFYNWASDNKVTVISVNESYSIIHEDIVLEGVMSPISYLEGDRFEVLKMNFGQRQYDQLAFEMNIKNTIDTIAFNNSGDEYLSGIKVHHVKGGKDIITASNQIDYERFYKSLEGVSKSIEKKLFYAREGFQCEKCSYKNICRGWRG